MNSIEAVGELRAGFFDIGVDFVDVSIGGGRPGAVEIPLARGKNAHDLSVCDKPVDMRDALAGFDKFGQLFKEEIVNLETDVIGVNGVFFRIEDVDIPDYINK